MDEVVNAVNRIQSINGARVDRNYRQGRYVFFLHFQAQYRRKVKDVSDIDNDIARFRKYLKELREWVAPHGLPDDYVFFLEFFGGLSIKTLGYNLLVEGFGPMTEEWYGFIMGDDALFENGFLLVSSLVFREEKSGQYVHFFLDLAGVVQRYCVIGMEIKSPTGIELVPILRNPHAHPNRWAKHGNSFTEWLEQLAATNGTFGYL